jgi:hypothetical protein
MTADHSPRIASMTTSVATSASFCAISGGLPQVAGRRLLRAQPNKPAHRSPDARPWDISTGVITENAAKSMSLVPVTVPDVLVRAVGKKNPNVRFSGRNGIGPIPKECDITFEIADPGRLRPGTTIEWVVRNEGAEAESVNDLGHRAGTGLRARKPSAYTGTHYMDCILRQNGIYGVRRIPVRISGGIRVPLRNPAQRPSWTNLRAGR